MASFVQRQMPDAEALLQQDPEGAVKETTDAVSVKDFVDNFFCYISFYCTASLTTDCKYT